MKPAALALALLSLAAAVDLVAPQKQLPACSLECLVEGVTAHGCAITDFACQCSRLEPLIRTVAPCLVKAGCRLEDITATAKVVLGICRDQVGAAAASGAAQTGTATGSIPTSAATALARDAAWGIVAVAMAAAVA